MEKKEIKSFLMFRSYLDAIREMTPEDAKAFVLALGDYAFCGKEPELSGTAKVAFIASKVTLDRSIQRYEKCVENGRKGGAPKGNQNARKQPKNNQETTKEVEGKITNKNNRKQPKNNLYKDMDKDMDIVLPEPTPLNRVGSEELFQVPTLNNNYISKDKEIITPNINNLVTKESGDSCFDSCFEDENYYEKQDGNLVFHNGSYEEEQELNYWE